MPRVDVAPQPAHKFRVALALVLACGLVAAVVGAVVWLKMATTKKPAAPKTEVVLKSAQDKLFTHNYDSAIADLLAQLKLTNDSAEKQSLYMQLAVAYEAKKDYANALDAFQKADAIKSGFGTIQSVARVKGEMGDKAGAIADYKHDIELVKSGQIEEHYADIPELESAIRQLGGTP